MQIIPYVIEEVERQGHDTNVMLDGVDRVWWMLEAWSYAYEYRKQDITLVHVEEIGKLVEQDVNVGGFRRVPVYIGGREGAPANCIHGLLHELLAKQNDLKPLEFYMQYEGVHPFLDGNGRSGKILLNWKNKTLHDPIFPPNDIWGRPIRNP